MRSRNGAKLKRSVVRTAWCELMASVDGRPSPKLRRRRPHLSEPPQKKDASAKRQKRLSQVASCTRRLPSPMSILASERRRGHECSGDYEHRTGSGQTAINCCQAGGGLLTPLALSASSNSGTYGFVGGLDFTSRNLLAQSDGLIAGFLTGYAETNLNLTTTSISLIPGNVGNGSSILQAHLFGPSVGGFATYFNGNFSIDNTFKADFFHLGESFTDNLSFTTTGTPLVPVSFATFSGAGSTDLVNYNSFGNVNYRFYTSEPYWIEPTVATSTPPHSTDLVRPS